MASMARDGALMLILLVLVALCGLQIAEGHRSPALGQGRARVEGHPGLHRGRRRQPVSAHALHSVLAEGDEEVIEGGDDAEPAEEPAGEPVDEPAVRTASHGRKLDPANFVVVAVAALVLWYCAERALRPPYMKVQDMSERERAEYNEILEAGEMHLSTTIIFVVVASCSLVLMFFFMSSLGVLLNGIFAFVALVALSATLYPYIEHLTERKLSAELDIPLLGPIPQLAFVIAPFAAIIVFMWLVSKSWVLNNILAICLVVFFLTTIRLSSLMVASALLLLAFVYDIFWVFCSSYFFGDNVMVSVATGLDIPIKILVPLFLPGGGEDEFTLIGLGDIVLPGLLICFALRFDDYKGLEWNTGYFAWTMVGYIVGLTVCEVVVGVFHIAQPAMIYLVPGTLLPILFLALSRGEVAEIWNGIGAQTLKTETLKLKEDEIAVTQV